MTLRNIQGVVAAATEAAGIARARELGQDVRAQAAVNALRVALAHAECWAWDERQRCKAKP